MEIVTDQLDPATLQSELSRVIEWLMLHGVWQVQITFGVGAAIPPDDLWTPVALQTAELQAFVNEAIAEGCFSYGRTDLHIYDAATFVKTSERTFRCNHPAVRFTFCHEADLHFQAADQSLLDEVKRDWVARGYSGYETPNDDVSGREWKRFG